jgi:hypothetical protein
LRTSSDGRKERKKAIVRTIDLALEPLTADLALQVTHVLLLEVHLDAHAHRVVAEHARKLGVEWRRAFLARLRLRRRFTLAPADTTTKRGRGSRSIRVEGGMKKSGQDETDIGRCEELVVVRRQGGGEVLTRGVPDNKRDGLLTRCNFRRF